VDLLFNNAGDMLGRVPLEQQTPVHIRRVLDLNVSSVILVTQAVLPLLGRGSVIVNMSSAAGRDGGGPGAATYAAAKAAVLGLTRGWAKEFAPRGIRVFAVAPGVIATDFHLRNSKPEQLAQFARDCPLGKLGQVNDVARAVLYLAGEGAGFMTGVTVDLNGGRTMA
jgi:3-oxoacyl-[acyl-carrier protein] reductase